MAGILRVARFEEMGRTFWAFLEGDDWAREAEGDPFRGLRPIGAPRPIEGLRWRPPVSPSKIVGVGRNYRAHAAELGHDVPAEPLLFLKPPSALIGHEEAIRLPSASQRVDYEGELGVVIGRTARAVPERSALDCVLGYTCVNDVTARDLQKRDVQFTRAKGFDTFCPVGPCLAVGVEPGALEIATHVNGVAVQRGRVTDMIFGIARLISAISAIMTLEPGDLIATGTPEGVGPLHAGDVVEVVVAEIGILGNPVLAAAG
jgi:2-keto-4-pentenoate hydratase/2-oxohepta-3-ene-1,7-dioic acid hydratase in catechol pathway